MMEEVLPSHECNRPVLNTHALEACMLFVVKVLLVTRRVALQTGP